MNQEIGKTAFLIVQWRADESKVRSPLFEDPYAALFTSDESKLFAEKVDQLIPSLRLMARLRTRYFDEILHRCQKQGAYQSLILGSGFDMRAQRFSHLGLKTFEVDQEPILDFKKNQLRKNGVKVSPIFVAGNYLEPSLLDRLKDSGFDEQARTFILWEGNTFYLPTLSLHDFLARLKSRFSDFFLGFDYVFESVVRKTTGFEGLTRFAELLEAQGATLKSGIDDIGAFAEKNGFRLLENLTQYQLHQRYAPEVPVDEKLFGVYSVCLMRHSSK